MVWMKNQRPPYSKPQKISQPVQPRPVAGRTVPGPAAPAAAKGRVTHWDSVTEWYDQLVGDEGSEYHQKVILPGVLRMLPDGEGLSILDVACGQGVMCRQLAGRGHHVVGIDAAAGLIEAAKRREEAERLGVRYVMGDATKLEEMRSPVLDAQRFDAITIVLAIQNMTPLTPVWKGCHGLLNAGGKLVVVMMHPCFRVPRGSDWIWDERTGTQGRVVKEYLGSKQVEIDMHPGRSAAGKGSVKTVTFHRPLQAYVNTLGNAGLLVDHVEEWVSHKVSEAGPKKEEMDRSRKEIPMFMALRARKG